MTEHHVYVAEAYVDGERIEQIVHINEDDVWRDIEMCSWVEQLPDRHPDRFGDYTSDDLEQLEIERTVEKKQLYTGKADPWWCVCSQD